MVHENKTTMHLRLEPRLVRIRSGGNAPANKGLLLLLPLLSCAVAYVLHCVASAVPHVAHLQAPPGSSVPPGV
jgi:hypothetical protein